MIRTVVVGAGGPGALEAVAWAAEEAAADARTRLVVMLACPPGSPLAGYPDEPSREALTLADPRLARTVAGLRARLGGQRVVVRAPAGAAPHVLTLASQTADLLVVGAGRSGATTRRVVRHAGCPVVVVRGRPGGRGSTFAGQEVVAVTGDTADSLLGFAFDHADRHCLPIVAMCVAAPGSNRLGEVVEQLRDRVRPWAEKHPQVPVRRAVMRGAVAETLSRAGTGAALLVLGHRRHGVLSRPGGDLTMNVVANADCPLAVVPCGRSGGDLP
jgi:nucleotide-binding universal stress UspA family protein